MSDEIDMDTRSIELPRGLWEILDNVAEYNGLPLNRVVGELLNYAVAHMPEPTRQ